MPDAVAPKKQFWTFRRVILFLGLLIVPILAFVGYSAFTLSWSYSTGERAGLLQKLSKKGWVCKTYEGELAMTSSPGVAPVIWTFSVRDENVVTQLNLALGKPVVLRYEEHRGLPSSCFGETPYFVSGVEVREDR